MKNIKYLFLLIFIVMISAGFVSATDNESASNDALVTQSSSMDVKTASDIDTVEYTVKSTSELNSIINNANTDANNVVINVDKDNFTDDRVLLFNLGNQNQSHKNGGYNPVYTAEISKRNQSYKNVLINANNATFDLRANFLLEDLRHIDMEISSFGDDTIYCGIIEVGNDYTLVFNNVNLKRYDMLNFGTVIFNNSSLTSPQREDFVVDNHGTVIIENSIVEHVYNYCDIFSNYENATLIVNNSQFKEEKNLFDDAGALFAGGIVIIDGQVINTSVLEHSYNEYNDDDGLSTQNNDLETEKINSMITIDDIAGTAGEAIPVNIHVTDFDGNKINGGYVNIYFSRDNLNEFVGLYKYDESGKAISMINPINVEEPMNFEVIDGVATAYVLFTRYDYSYIMASYSGTENVNPSDLFGMKLSSDFPLRNASINVINEEQTADSVILTVEVKDLSGSKLLDYLDEDGLSYSITNGPDYELPEISNTHYYEENGMFYLVLVKDELDKTMDTFYADITYVNPAYNEVSIGYSFTINKTDTENIVPKENTDKGINTTKPVQNVSSVTVNETSNNYNKSINIIKPFQKVNKVTINASSKKVNKVLPTATPSLKTIDHTRSITLERLNEIFGMDFSNQTLLIYIGDTLVYNGTTTDDLLEVLFKLTDEFDGKYTITVKTSNDTTYNETIII